MKKNAKTANKGPFTSELIAGTTTFLTMSYIMFVNPAVLHNAGMPTGAVFVATCLVAALGCLLTGLISNLPIAIAPAMAVNVYIAEVVVKQHGFSWQSSLGTVIISGIIFILLTVTQFRTHLINALPKNITHALGAGIGLFIVVIGLKNIGLIALQHQHIVLQFNVEWISLLLTLLGFSCIYILNYFHVHGSIMLGIIIVTSLSLLLGLTQWHGILQTPPSLLPVFAKFNFNDLNTIKGIGVIFSILLIALFDSTGTVVGLFPHKKNKAELSRVLLAESITTTAAGVLGTMSTSPYLESAAGIRAGGKTGLTSFIVAALFLAALFCSPLAKTIPSFAITPALLFVGLLMLNNIKDFKQTPIYYWPAMIVTIVAIPVTFSIADGLGIGFLIYILTQLLRRRLHELTRMQIVLAAIFIVYFALLLFD